jgi:hypothetical protein
MTMPYFSYGFGEQLDEPELPQNHDADMLDPMAGFVNLESDMRASAICRVDKTERIGEKRAFAAISLTEEVLVDTGLEQAISGDDGSTEAIACGGGARP